MASRQDSEDSEDEGDPYDYNNGIAPYPGAVWTEFGNWASNPIDPEIYDEQGNYRIPPEDIVVEPTPAAALAAAAMPASMPAARQPQESRIDQFRRRRREIVSARRPAPAPVVAVPPPPPTPPTEAERIAEASIGLPSPWKAIWSNRHNDVYYFDPRNGQSQWKNPTMGGKRTRRHLRPRSRAKRSKRKRSMRRRKRTSTRRK